MNIPRFFVSQIIDRYVQENFQSLQAYLDSAGLLSSFKGFEVSFTSKADHYKFIHNLGFLPKDVIVTSIIHNLPTGTVDDATIKFNAALATAQALDITISGDTVTKDNPLTVRFLAGTFDTGA